MVDLGWWYVSASTRLHMQAWWLELHTSAQGRRREPTPESCFLTPSPICLHVHTKKLSQERHTGETTWHWHKDIKCWDTQSCRGGGAGGGPGMWLSSCELPVVVVTRGSGWQWNGDEFWRKLLRCITLPSKNVCLSRIFGTRNSQWRKTQLFSAAWFLEVAFQAIPLTVGNRGGWRDGSGVQDTCCSWVPFLLRMNSLYWLATVPGSWAFWPSWGPARLWCACTLCALANGSDESLQPTWKKDKTAAHCPLTSMHGTLP